MRDQRQNRFIKLRRVAAWPGVWAALPVPDAAAILAGPVAAPTRDQRGRGIGAHLGGYGERGAQPAIQLVAGTTLERRLSDPKLTFGPAHEIKTPYTDLLEIIRDLRRV